MDFYGVNMTGPFRVQKVSSVPSRFEVSKDRGRIVRIEKPNGADQFWVGVGDTDNLVSANATEQWWKKINLNDVDPNELQTIVRLREIYTYTGSTTTSPVDVIIPNGGTYTVDGESLEVYLNRIRLLTSDYQEISNNAIRFPNGLVNGDVIEFYEKSGYVDTSDINYSLITDLTDLFYVEHNNDGTHDFELDTSGFFTETTLNNIFTSDRNTSENGYQELPGGLIIQWGKAVGPTGEVLQTQFFNIPFPTAAIHVQTTSHNPNVVPVVSYDAFEMMVKTWTRTNFTYLQQSNTGNVGQNFILWFAIGY